MLMPTKAMTVSATLTCTDPSRRNFCAQAARATCCVAVSLVLESCGGSNSSPTAPGQSSALPVVNGTRVTGGITVPIDNSSPLATVGSPALVQTSGGSFLVAQIGSNNFVALTAICTHQGCTITNANSEIYVCPCHGSKFDLNGHVVNGPAVTALRQYPTQFADGVLTITA